MVTQISQFGKVPPTELPKDKTLIYFYTRDNKDGVGIIDTSLVTEFNNNVITFKNIKGFEESLKYQKCLLLDLNIEASATLIKFI